MSSLSPSIVVAACYPPLGRFIVSALRGEGYQPLVLADGAQALAHLRSQPFELALLDAELAKADGFHICQQVRKVSPAPIALLVTRGDTAQLVRGRQVGADAPLFIPFGMDELLTCVGALLPTPAVFSS